MYQRILVPFDGSVTSTSGLDEAIRLARLTGASMRLIHVVDDLQFASGFETYAVYSNDVIQAMRQAGEKILQEGKARAQREGVATDTVLLEGVGMRLADVVADQVKSWSADLLVIGTHGRRGMSRLLLGSDAEQILRTASVPVLLVRATPSAAKGTSSATATATA